MKKHKKKGRDSKRFVYHKLEVAGDYQIIFVKLWSCCHICFCIENTLLATIFLFRTEP